jgi:hypothetical protein
LRKWAVVSEKRIRFSWYRQMSSKLLHGANMSKSELIDCICQINRTARAEFLSTFSEEDLKTYLEHLMELDLDELSVCC